MNRDTMRELLTAAVDGVLPAHERKNVQRLLQESAEARTLLAQLKRDAARLKALAKVNAPVDFAAAVMSQIQENGLTPIPLPPKPTPTRFRWAHLPIWANIATAASVLLLISIGSYLYFIASQQYFAAQKSKELIAKTGPSSTVVEGSGVNSVDTLPLPLPGEHPKPAVPDVVVQQPKQSPSPEVGPTPRVVPLNDVLTSPVRPIPEIDFSQLEMLRMAQFYKLNDLPANETLRKKFVADCKHDELLRLDLFCKVTPKNVEAVQRAFKAKGVNFILDAYAQERLKKNQETEIVFFTEALTPEEIATVFTTLGSEDNKANGVGGFDTLVVAPFLHADLATLGRLLGIANVLSKLPKISPNVIDIRKPLPEGTAQQLAQTLSKMGSTGTPQPKEEKAGIAVAYRPSNPNPANSREIKAYLQRRGDKKPDAKPLMLVLRVVN